MSVHSVAEAKANLPRLIDLAMNGEEVVITRRGKPVAELRAAQAPEPRPNARQAAFARLVARRTLTMPAGMNSVSILRDLEDEE